jgi:hypothetical protein
MGLTATLIALGVQWAVIGLCLWQDRKPAEIGRVRLFPYRLVILTLGVMSIATLAHAVSVATGKPILPRTSKFGSR